MQAGLPFLCHVLATITRVVFVTVMVVVVPIMAVVVVPIRTSRVRIAARSGSVSVVGKQWFRPGAAIQAVEPICQRAVRTRGTIARLVVPAVVSRIIVPVVVVAGCVIVT